MDEFIDGDIAERGELIRQLDRIRDRAVQSIRILEQEKAVNLGLLKSKQINRKIAERAALFVDVQNMFYAARQQFNGRLDFQRLLARVAVDRKLFKAIAYIVETPDIDQTHFITLLTKSGYEVKSKELRTRGDGSAKGNWDMEMAMDIISLLPKLDVMILVSGDGDFVPLVQKIKSESRVKCEIYGFEHNTAIDLKEIADKFQAIGRDLLLDTASEEN
ncbi:NYN domain-containing protein [bacterium]|nr:NYN domain-containing protein [bacterium]